MFRKLFNKLFDHSVSSRVSNPRKLGIERCEDRYMLAANMGDVVFALDESGSEAEASTQEWVSSMIAGVDLNGNGDRTDPGDVLSLADQLASVGIDDVRYGLVGFGQSIPGNPGQPPIPRYAHSQLLPDDNTAPLVFDQLFADADVLSTATLNTVFNANTAQFGGQEDGHDAIEHIIAEYDFRDGAVPIIVMMQNDEGRSALNNTLTRDGILAALDSKNVILNSMIVGESVYDDNNTATTSDDTVDWEEVFGVAGFNGRIFGVEADAADGLVDGLHNYYGYDNGATTGQFDPLSDTLAGSTSLFNEEPFPTIGYDQGLTETNDSYIQMAWDTGGAAWDIGIVDEFLTIDSDEANALRDTFITSLGNQINAAHAEGKVFRTDNVVLALNLGGDAIPSEGFVADDGTYTADYGYFDQGPFHNNRESDIGSIIAATSNSVPDDVAGTAPVTEVF